MSRAELWAALAGAADAVQAAVDEYERAPTPQRRAVRDAAFREYVRRLPHLIGNLEASRYGRQRYGRHDRSPRRPRE